MFFQKKSLTRFVLLLLLSVHMFVGLFSPRLAYAQLVVNDPVNLAENIRQFLKEDIGNMLLGALLNSLVQGASYFLNKLAYDSAKALASKAKGEKPVAFRDGFGEYLKDEAENAAGEAIGELGKPFGINLCQIPNVNINLYLKIGLRKLYADSSSVGEPDCSWQDIQEGWSSERLNSLYGKEAQENMLDNFQHSLTVEQSDFGIAFGAIAEVDRVKAEKKEEALLTRQEGRGWQSITSLISGDILTPATVIEEESKALTAKHKGELSAGQIAGIYGTGAKQIIPSAMGVFLNTLSSDLLNHLMTKGLFPDRGKKSKGGDSDIGSADAYGGSADLAAAENAFSFLLTRTPTKKDNFDILSEFASCPQDTYGLNNCVIDDKMQALLGEARFTPLTLREALADGKIDGSLPIISPRHAWNDDKDCYQRGYCYSNLQKLRRSRIIPLGWEIAAVIADPDRPPTLKEVMDGFYTCEANGMRSPAKPYCHLIDPNWVIKVPDAKCDSYVTGPILALSGAPVRKEECADISTCLKTNPDGSCADNQYGYCTKERNVWRMPGEACEAQFATCRTFAKSSDGSLVSYLTRTIDYGECSAEAVGCRAYALQKNSLGKWISTADQNNNAKGVGNNQAAYLGSAVADQVCTSDSEGCSLVFDAKPSTPVITAATTYTKGSAFYLKKAPAYLGCYDTVPSTDAIDWPTTLAQLRNNTKAEDASCQPFAGACLSSEVGCDMYAPIGDAGAAAVPGNIGDNYCSPVCAGYDTFRELPSELSKGVSRVQFIPSMAESCQAEFVGCSEFTNIEEGAGAERREYYSSIKYCEKPTGTNEKTFYSWEGSESRGFVLKTYKLLQVSAEASAYVNGLASLTAEEKAAFPAGSPAYADDSGLRIKEALAACNATRYDDLINGGPNPADPSCKSLFDDSGAVFYRLDSQTVSVSSACHRIRKTDTELYTDTDIAISDCATKGGRVEGGVCQRCVGGGRFENNSCVYSAIVGGAESRACSSSQNLCRAYAGNNAGNVQDILPGGVMDFEPSEETPEALVAAKDGWSAGSVVGESTQAGLHSLMIPASGGGGNSTLTISGDRFASLSSSDALTVSFWAKSTRSASLSVTLVQQGRSVNFTEDPLTGEVSDVSLSTEWREYSLSVPTSTLVSGGDTLLSFTFMGDSSTKVYLDTVRLTRTVSAQFLKKNSWQRTVVYNGSEVLADVPLACDANPTDSFAGEFLGCRGYTDTNNQNVYATGFASLCRPAAAGCTPIIDGFNTRETSAVVYNAWCARSNPSETECSITVSGEKFGPCVLIPGSNGCYIEKMELPASVTAASIADEDWVVDSTLIFPEDTPLFAPIFLTAQKAEQCGQEHLGCMKAGVETLSVPPGGTGAVATSTDTFVAVNPSQFDKTLCRAEFVGCEAFTSGADTSYFKDPSLYGNAFCEYKENTLGVDGARHTGWFKKGIGRCSNNLTVLCADASDCGTGNTCQDIGQLACNPSSIGFGGVYEAPSNGTGAFQGYVAECVPKANLCTEFIDKADTSGVHGGGAVYHIIADDRTSDAIGECKGKVSLNDGCVAFDQTDNPTKNYNTAASYERSKNNTVEPFGSVDPVSDAGNDANVIMKVRRDRECAEWLSCRSTMTVRLESGGSEELCTEFRLCDASLPGVTCARPVDTARSYESGGLSVNTYTRRDVSWYGREYSGISSIGHHNINDYIYLSFPGDTLKYAAYRVPQAVFDLFPTASCQTSGGDNREDWTACGVDRGGRCYAGSCLYPPNGSFSVAVNSDVGVKNELTSGSCKQYPESDSPYPRTVVANVSGAVETLRSAEGAGERSEFRSKKQDFVGANVCQTDGTDCSCEYQKVTYESGVTDYWPFELPEGTEIPSGVCMGSSNNGRPCANDSECGTGSACQKVRTKDKLLGTLGYCLEYDISRPINGGVTFGGKPQYACLTWLPIRSSASTRDVNNMNPEAGYYPPLDAKTTLSGGRNIIAGQNYCASSYAHGAGNLEYLGDYFRVPGGNGWRVDSLNQIDDIRFFSSYQPSRTNSTFASKIQGPNGLAYPITSGRDTQLSCWYDNNDHSPAGDSTGAYGVTDVLCSAFQNYDTKKDMVTFLQLWSMRWLPTKDGEIGASNAYLLRAETGRVDSQDFGYQCDGVDCAVYALFPTVREDTGALLHSPRFTQGNSSNNVREFYKDATMSYEVTSDNTSANVYTDALAGGVPAGEGSTLARSLFISSVESGLHESELDSVYIIPLGISDGQEGVFPPTLSKDFVLRVGSLRATLASNHAKSAVETVIQNIPLYVDGHADSCGSCSSDEDDVFQAGPMDGSGSLWSYVLERAASSGSCSGLYSNCSYTGNLYRFTNSSAQTSNLVNDVRNQVYRRYVSVLYSSSNPFFSSITNSAPTNPQSDPFSESFTCQSFDHAEWQEDWYAIGMDFNADGEFLGYISRFCSPNGQDSGLQTAVVATLKDSCKNVLSVYDDRNDTDENGETNKALTDRVWQYTSFSALPGNPAGVVPSGAYKTWVYAPAGSLTFSTADWFGAASSVSTFMDKLVIAGEQAGVPWGCSLPSNDDDILLTSRSVACKNATIYAPNSVTTDVADAIESVNSNTQYNSQNALHNLFAKYYANVIISRVAGSRFPSGDFSTTTVDWSVDNSHYNAFSPPQLYPINPFSCLSGGTMHCTAGGKHGFTVNSMNGDISQDYDNDGYKDEDKDGDRQWDGLVGYGSMDATIRFFGWADHNRMPIRRVVINWMDGRPPEVMNGYYTNKKPYCADDDAGAQFGAGTEAVARECRSNTSEENSGSTGTNGNSRGDGETGLTCGSTGSGGTGEAECDMALGSSASCQAVGGRFGNSPRACTEGYFEFSHNYSCGSAELASKGVAIKFLNDYALQDVEDRLIAEGWDPNDKVCLFRPRVQLRDNWGWCNATLDDTRNGRNTDTDPVSWPNDNGDKLDYDEISPLYSGLSGDLCGTRNSLSYYQFKQYIVVTPYKSTQ